MEGEGGKHMSGSHGVGGRDRVHNGWLWSSKEGGYSWLLKKTKQKTAFTEQAVQGHSLIKCTHKGGKGEQ